MKISRWIYIPLIFGLLFPSMYALFGIIETVQGFIGVFILGTFFGFGIEAWSQYRARKKSGINDEEIHNVRQKREFAVLQTFEKTFEIVVEAVEAINPSKIKIKNIEDGVIEAKTRMSWESFGIVIRIELKKVDERLIEVEIKTRPVPRTALVDYGEGWKYSEEISEYIKNKDKQINLKLSAPKNDVPNNIYDNFRSKEKVKR